MKSKENIKEAILPVIKEIATTCKQNLSSEEYQKIMLEFAITFISASINFNQPSEDFRTELAKIMTLISIQGGTSIIECKKAFDRGEDINEII